MFTVIKKSALGLVSSAMLLVSTSLWADTFTETFSVDSGGELYLRTDIGRLIIDSHDKDEVLMEVELRGEDTDKFDLSHDVSNNKVSIIGKVEGRNNWRWNRNLKVEFRITVPKEFDLEMHTSGGSIDIEDLIGNIDAHTSGGSIEVGSVIGNVELKTSGGSIETAAIEGEIDAHTSGGSIRVTIAKQPTNNAELSTSGGSIVAYLLDDIAIDLDASTSGGRVRSEFEVDGRTKKQSIRGEINGGGPELELRTSGGSVSVKRLRQ